jgi:AGZA family xanthine/uracil permease-like MFS transporter
MKRLLTFCGFDARVMRLRTEIVAGLTTFLTMCYILAVGPSLMAATGMDRGAVFTATALAAALATLWVAFAAKYPFAQAPAMALNAFVAFVMADGMGYSWEAALAAMFAEGILLLVCTLTGIRETILNGLPACLRYAIPAGIGLFIAFTGLKNAGVIVSSPHTLVRLGEFSAPALLALGGLLLGGVLTARKVKGALFVGILLCTLAGIPLGVTHVPEGFLPLSAPRSLAPTFLRMDLWALCDPEMAAVIFALLLMQISDTTGTLAGLASKGGFVDATGRIPRVKQAMLADAIGTTASAMLGTVAVTTYAESAAGIAEGGRSGVASLVTGTLFVVALFLAPLFLLIPVAAVAGTLTLVGALMVAPLRRIDLDDMSEALPAFVTILLMTLTYSIADGMMMGMICYATLRLLAGKGRELSPAVCVMTVLFILYYVLI